MHGEYRHLKRHAELVETLGVPAQNVLITDVGNTALLTGKSLKFGESVQAGTRLIDGGAFEEYGASEVIKERLKMAEEGIFTVSIASTGGYLLGEPVVQSRGYVFPENSDMEAEVQALAIRAVQSYDYAIGTKDELCNYVKKTLRNYFYKKTKQAPLIIVSVLDV